MPFFSDPIETFKTVIVLIMAVTVHEYAHALAAHRLGDDTAARMGRLTLNPAAHADIFGTILCPAFIGFGWGKPVPYLPTNLTRKYSMRACEAMVAFAGPFSNLVMSVVAGFVLAVFTKYEVIAWDSPFVELLARLVQINVALFLFNLIPIPPLDGSKIAAWIFGQRADRLLDTLAGLGPIGIIVAIFIAPFLISPFAGALIHAIFNIHTLV